MGLNLLPAIASLLAQVEELLTLLNSALQLTLRFIDHADLLIALSFDIAVLSLLSHLQALLKELERHVELVAFEVLVSDHLVDANQILRDVTHDVDELTALSFL